MLTIGIPKNRHMLSGVIRLCDCAGLAPQPVTESLQKFQDGVEGQILVLKPKRLAILAVRGRVDAAIIGQDMLEESGGDFEVLAHLRKDSLGLRQTRVVVFAHCDDQVEDVKDIPDGSTVLSEYPRLTQEFFGRRHGINVIPSPGGSEAEVPLLHRFGVAVVDSGETLRKHFLKELGTIITSVPVLVRSGYMPLNDEKLSALVEMKKALRDAILDTD